MKYQDRQSFILFLAFVWGFVWAASLQFTDWGRWLATRRTWITVVIGVGVDLLLVMFLVPWRFMRLVVTVIVLSSIGIIGRSLANELKEHQELTNLVIR